MHIRDAQLDDAAAISELVSGCVREQIAPTLSEAGVQTLLSEMDMPSMESYLRGDFRFFLAEVEGTLIGLSAVKRPAHLFYLFVRSDFQRRGVGRRLWTHTRGWILEDNDADTITVNSSLNAVSVYERFGFMTNGDVVEKNQVRFQPMQWLSVKPLAGDSGHE